MPQDRYVETVQIQEAWLQDFPFLRLALGPSAPFGPVVKLRQKTLLVPEFHICSASLGNVTALHPQVVAADGGDMEQTSLNVCGCDRNLELACAKAVAEAAERTACVLFPVHDVVSASAEELGSDALDWERLPRGSQEEYADPRRICEPFSPSARLRWVPGVSLVTGDVKYVPLALAYMTPPDLGTRYWLPISTGAAAHTDVAAAMVNAVCEVIERDAIALTWLLRLPLPKLVVEGASSVATQESLDTLAKSGVRHLMFDATTDLGVPTVYSVQLRDGEPNISTLVSCATDFDVYSAMGRTIRECAAASLSFELSRDIPDDPRSFVRLEDGAIYMGRPSQRGAFSFLVDSRDTVLPSCHPSSSASPHERLATLRALLAARSMDALIVDITSDDLRRSGLVVVRAIVPDLMPLSCVTRFRYLGHPRLHNYAKAQGIDLSRPYAINPLPQPFA